MLQFRDFALFWKHIFYLFTHPQVVNPRTIYPACVEMLRQQCAHACAIILRKQVKQETIGLMALLLFGETAIYMCNPRMGER